MTIQTRDDDAGPRPQVAVIRDDDHRSLFLMAALTVNLGGTGSNLSATGPGMVVQLANGSTLTVVELNPGEIIVGGSDGAPLVLGPNQTSTRKFLMQNVLFDDTPVLRYVEIAATDIKSGVVGVEHGGTGGDNSATGPGALVQGSVGSAFTVELAPPDSDLVLKEQGGAIVFGQVFPNAYADNSINHPKLAQSAARSVIGRAAASVGNVADIEATADGQVLRRASGTLGFGSVGTAVATTVGAAGGASALPATPLGYLSILLPNGTSAKIPYYNT